MRRVAAGSSAIDQDRWPDVATVPAVPLRAAAARLAVSRAARKLHLRVSLDGGHAASGAPDSGQHVASMPAELVIRRPADFYRRLGGDGPLGFGEAYMAGDWESADLAGLLTFIGIGYRNLIPAALKPLRPLLTRRRPTAEDQTIAGSQRNIEQHYDLSPEMFAAFLDETMTYSCALFSEDATGAPIASALAPAQRRKINAILDLAGVTSGTRLLEIGTGWGELALTAAGRDASVVTITNSPRQHAAASQRLRAMCAGDQISVKLLDYRQVSGQFDAVVSVEMIEAVGDEYWPLYFATIDAALAPGGRAVIQAITLPHQRMLQVRRGYSWMDKYIFPGAVIPSRQAIEDTLARHTSLRITHVRPMAAHYALTLRAWRAQFDARREEIGALGFDEVFCRMWQFYLAYSEAGFRTGLVDVGQYVLERS